MSTLIYPTAISDEVYNPDSLSSPTGQDYAQDLSLPDKISGSAKTGSYAAFICHVARVEAHLLRGDKSKFFEGRYEVKRGSRRPLGNGASFIVDRAELGLRKRGSQADDIPLSMKFVAIKTVRDQPSYVAVGQKYLSGA
jgi:hypothetical protein